MKYCYLVFTYQPKYKYDGFVHEGRYNHIPHVFLSYEGARAFKRSYKHCAYIRKVLLRS